MSEQAVRLDYAYCLTEALGKGQGLELAALKALQAQADKAHASLEQQRQAGSLGFWQLPAMGQEDLAAITGEADRLRGLADNLVVLGIGGSALGATAVDMALSGVFRQSLPCKNQAMRLFVADNSDPRMFCSLLSGLDPQRTVYNVVSKSGSTAETMSQFLVVLERLERALGAEEARRRILFTTDPEKGNLRLLANREAFPVLTVPPNVGGRYSVLSAVGLLPLACAGHDVKALLDGAAAMASRCLRPGLLENPAYLFAALAVAMQRAGRNILVMMPYVSDLLGLAQWFAQLWAESLGKALSLDGRRVNLGQTPVAAVGATDQHSQLQLYMEGPQDKLVCFLTLANYGADLEIPALYPEIAALAYLGGRSMSELIQAEALATAAALASQGRPSLSLRLPQLDAQVMGQLIFLLEAATVAAGAMLEVNPLDQPGVELSKELTYGLMGRPGFAEQKKRLEQMDQGARFVA
ncbi:MAG: glucose-6-phosphate isomerase [Desulfarculus sp.]|nr:glucose-6-phosphate isomerase [Desulfarculus sp.]